VEGHIFNTKKKKGKKEKKEFVGGGIF